jgi:tRNA (guanine37-N1)-methyltransferase
VIGRAIENGHLDLEAVDLRRYTHDRRGTVDDSPYGGGPGMLMKIEPLAEALDDLKAPGKRLILLGPRGKRFDQAMARELSQEKELLFICGHYEGLDERLRSLYEIEEVSLGDYVLTSGNLAAMVMIDAVTRLIPGVLGCDESGEDESFSEGLLEYPQYTRPVEFRGLRVPAVLQSGDHGAITRWRRQQAEKLTRRLRPDLYKKAVFKRLAGISMKEWKKTTKKFLIQKEILKNGNSQESRSGIPEK